MPEARLQSFSDSGDRTASPGRVAALRRELDARGLDGFLVPRADAHQNEYVPPSEERLAFVSGFTGSAGLAIVLRDRAALFVDGRYSVQARDEVDGDVFALVPLGETAPEAWIEANLTEGLRLGYDPWLHTRAGAARLKAACDAVRARLLAVDGNPVDAVWHDRPPPPRAEVTSHDLRFAGESRADKLARLRDALARQRIDALVVTDPHAVAWLFNIRGGDVAHTPLPLSFAIVPRDAPPQLYVDPRKLGAPLRAELAAAADLRAPEALLGALCDLGARTATVRFDEATAADALVGAATQAGARLSQGPDPLALMKAVKNPVEIEGARAAHRRDGAAVTRFLAWLDREAPRGHLTEIDAVVALETFRRLTGHLKDVSFPTIAGAGANGAIVHYRVTTRTNRRINPGELFLVDSGGQYEDGTTDVTRTVLVGVPSGDMRDRFTRVLRGHIAVARCVFPRGTTGTQIDAFARRPLWQAGLDFDHGTGHGVGSYLSVHEGPARLSKLATVALQPGMILSNEPGYYKQGAYGIRLENLLLVIEAPPIAGAERQMQAFETLTLVPFDRRLIDAAAMSAAEIAWVDAYHHRVARALTPLVDDETLPWLDAATRPLAQP